MSEEIVIVGAVRTPVGTLLGSLGDIPASQLGAKAIGALLERTGVKPEQVDEVILGQVLTGGAGMNPARQASLAAGIPYTTPAMTINMVCGSGLRAVHLAYQAVLCGDAQIVVAGGQESMSLAPHALPRSRSGQKMGEWGMKDTMIQDGLWCAITDGHMGNTAENIAREYDISRAEQDAFAAQSQQRAEAAIRDGVFGDEIVPIEIPQRKGDPKIFDTDEFPRPGTTVEVLSKLRPAFDREGTVTAGNASGINDGAAVVLVTTASRARELGLKPMARIVSFAAAGVDPAVMGTGPIPATRACLAKAGWNHEDLDLVESNEAFAAQAISVNKTLGWDLSKVNVSGGAIAIGHPIGASGARVLVTLLHGMQRRNARRGLATLCIGGGQGVAMAVERLD